MFRFKIFIGLSGGFGPLSRTFPLAEEFKKAGMEVCFSAYDETTVSYIKKAGYKVLSDDDPTMPREEFIPKPSSTFYNLDQYFAQMGLLDAEFTNSWIYSRINMLQDYQPNLVITDLSPNTMIAAKFLKIPTLSFVQSCLHPKGESFHNEVPRNLPKVTPIINDILSKLMLKPIEKMEDLSVGDKTLVPSFPELDPISCNIDYVGPITTNFIHNKNSIILPENYVLVYPGRLYDSVGETGQNIVSQVIEASKELKDYNFVISSSDKDLQNKVDIPENILVIPFFNEHILSKARLFIHHGGHGSCLASIKNTTPSLILPTHSERYFNAKKIAKYGFGDYLIPHSLTNTHFIQMIDFMFNDFSYQSNIKLYQKEIEKRDYKGEQRVFDIACSLIKRK
ncbi:nucleotide disphospho-sugar-binding domain-containing protein [Bacillus sp. SM2101]|uniref:glycosyltransferase n=1 Tax=Bacillus sp. SM2101 TaxID=2805366 RepID=UPI001BDF4027|nr:nucleotide disphospho-sugar-binding domain-containing protein [Bacillus sp. SM2101]